MTVNKFIRKLLNLKELSVTGFVFKQRQKRLELFVKPYKNGCRCPYCTTDAAKLNINAEGAVYGETCPCMGARSS